jgi:DNA polymerase-3 subunit gamma/tau
VQRFDFKRIPPQIVADRLRLICETEGVTVSDKALRLIARAGEGSMRDAQSLLDQVIAFAGEEPADETVLEILGLVDRSALYQMLEGLVGGEPHKSLETIHHVYEHGHDLAQFTAELLELVRNAALVRLSPKARQWMDVPPEEVERLEALCKDMPAPVFSHLFNALLDVQDQVARSPRPRMVLEMAVARLSSHRPVQPVDQLLERLEHLERRLQAKGAIPQAPGNGVGAPRKRAEATPSEEPPAAHKEPDPATELLDPPERYRSLLGELAEKSGEFRDLVEYSVFLGFAEGQLRIGFDSARALKHGRELVQQETLRKAADTWFPGLVRIHVENRETATGQTNTERRKAQATADQEALEQAVREDPLIQEICTQLGAEIEGVVPERLDP